MVEGVLTELTSQFWLVAAVFLRLGPAFFLAPGYGEDYVSARVRLVVALCFAAAIAPVLEPHLPDVAPTGSNLFWYVLRETALGTFIGLVSRGMIYLLEKASAIISQSISLSQMLGNATEPMPVVSHILTTTGIAILYSTTLADQMLYTFVAGYSLSMHSMSNIAGFLAGQASKIINYIFNQAVVLASGFLSLIFVYYLFIGFVNKAMPQFMVSFIGIPFVALFSIHFLYQHHDMLLSIWKEKAKVILMMPYTSQR